MPTQWSLTLTPPPLPGVLPAHLHALACALLESPTENHNAQTKPFTTALFRQRLTLGWLEEGTEPDLPSRLRAPVRLGTHVAEVSLADQRFEAYTRMAAAPPTRRVAVSFATPTYVNQAGRQLPLPVPELLLAIRSAAAGAGSNRRTGFVGHTIFGLPTRTSRRAQRAFTALWLFAAFAGVGAQTTQGLGHVRVRVDEEAPTGTRSSPAMTARVS